MGFLCQFRLFWLTNSYQIPKYPYHCWKMLHCIIIYIIKWRDEETWPLQKWILYNPCKTSGKPVHNRMGFAWQIRTGFTQRNLCRTHSDLTGFYTKWFAWVLHKGICAKPMQICLGFTQSILHGFSHDKICAKPMLIWPGFAQSILYGFYTIRIVQNPFKSDRVVHKVFCTGFTQRCKWMVPAKPVRNKLIE